MRHTVLVVDDEVAICDLIKISLEAEGFKVVTAYDGKEALEKIESAHPELLVLDVMLPGINGFDLCKMITSKKAIPIIMLTAKSDLVDKVLGLELGADDYITKPFHARELTARVKALLRRISIEASPQNPKHLTNGNLRVYPDKRKVVLKGKEVDLAVKEYELLQFLLKHLDQVFSREMLLEKVWGYDFAGDTRTVDVHIQRLRKKLKDGHAGDQSIQTVFGVGYRMKKQEA